MAAAFLGEALLGLRVCVRAHMCVFGGGAWLGPPCFVSQLGSALFRRWKLWKIIENYYFWQQQWGGSLFLTGRPRPGSSWVLRSPIRSHAAVISQMVHSNVARHRAVRRISTVPAVITVFYRSKTNNACGGTLTGSFSVFISGTEKK